jgi:2-phospho-L-lactate transferase/gluconeogenesis factor (CofD/UPF0052 family)
MKINKITLFCGGSGSESIIKYFLNQKNVQLTLLINAYDDGKSTGALRKNIPGLLGPSDFRKNFSYLINFFFDEQRNLKKVFEFRFKKKILINNFYFDIKNSENLEKYIPKEINFLEKEVKNKILNYLLISINYLKSTKINLINFSLGNLIFAGIFLNEKKNFNLTVKKFTNFISTNVKIINISNNENRWLIALNKNNKIIDNESNLVEKKQFVPIKEIFLIKKKINLSFINKENPLKYLKKINSIPNINPEAKNSILKSDLIIYGPGTQHSSLFPSFIIANKYIKKSNAKKIMVMNLERDNDIQNLKSKDILKSALKYLKCKAKTNEVINTVLVDENCKFNNLGIKFKDTYIKKIDLRNNFLKKIHSGQKVYDEIFYTNEPKNNKLMIFINLKGGGDENNLNIDHIDQIFNQDWSKLFSKLRVIINSKKKIDNKKIPSLSFVNLKQNFPEIYIFNKWFKKKDFNYLLTISGDGNYDLSKITEHINLIKHLNCGLLIGSRNQSRHQHFDNIKKIYGKNRILYFISKISEFFFIILYFLKLNFFLTDPNSGYRIYSKKDINFSKIKKNLNIPSALLKNLVKGKTEVLEVPIKYYVQRNFSTVIVRISQALKNIKGLYFD